VREGERLEAVGYVHREHADEFRPELLVRQDGRAIRQRSVPLPEGPPQAAAPSGPATGPAEPDPAAGPGSAGAGPLPWFVGGALLLGGATVVAVRAARKGGTSE
jgi:hypothetical protein